jgi:hypothetical protein
MPHYGSWYPRPRPYIYETTVLVPTGSYGVDSAQNRRLNELEAEAEAARQRQRPAKVMDRRMMWIIAFAVLVIIVVLLLMRNGRVY